MDANIVENGGWPLAITLLMSISFWEGLGWANAETVVGRTELDSRVKPSPFGPPDVSQELRSGHAARQGAKTADNVLLG